MKIKNLLTLFNNTSINSSKLQGFSTATGIEIPKRIARSSTDILKAISNTYQRDPTAAHYKYHDDPYLIPYSNFMKRSYALSQESGRKAAQWVRQQHADLFQHRVADPMIEAYVPKPVYNEDSEVNEDVLLKLMKSAQVSDAITVYSISKKKGIEFSQKAKQDFLEFLCYFNSEDPISEDWIEERWFRMSTSSDKLKNVWKPSNIVDELFEELKDSSPGAYSALISGMCLHGEVTKAAELYEEAKNKAIPLDVEVYNLLLGRAYLMKESHDLMWSLVKDILSQMNHMKVKPNVRTLNGILHTLSRMSTNRHSSKLSHQVMAEFKALNVEPSLATFVHLLEVYYKDKSKLLGVLDEVLNIMRTKVYTIQDPNDVLFFVKAMEICSQLKNRELAFKLYDILLKDRNYDFIGDSLKESIFYRNFFFVLINTEPLEKVMEFYDKLIPSIYIPEPAVMNGILNSIMDNMAWNLLPKIWHDITLFDQAEVSGVLENTLKCAAKNTDASLDNDMTKIAWDIWERMEGPRRERTLVQWTASMLGNALLTLLNGGERAKSHTVMEKLITLGSSLMNEPPVQAMKAYIDCCIEDNTPDLAIKAIKYCDDIGFLETSQFAQHLNSSLELSEKQKEKLASIVGTDCLKPPSLSKADVHSQTK